MFFNPSCTRHSGAMILCSNRVLYATCNDLNALESKSVTEILSLQAIFGNERLKKKKNTRLQFNAKTFARPKWPSIFKLEKSHLDVLHPWGGTTQPQRLWRTAGRMPPRPHGPALERAACASGAATASAAAECLLCCPAPPRFGSEALFPWRSTRIFGFDLCCGCCASLSSTLCARNRLTISLPQHGPSIQVQLIVNNVKLRTLLNHAWRDGFNIAECGFEINLSVWSQ